MVRNKDQREKSEKITRRAFVGASVSLTASAFASSTVSAKDGRQFPVRATGRRIHKIRRDGDVFVHEQRFVSPKLKEVYNHPVVEYDPITIPEEQAPDLWKEQNGTQTINYEDTGTFGTFEEHVNAESKIREQATEDNVSTQSHSYYDGPIYQYLSGSLDERKAPVNVAWERSLSLSAKDVKQDMNDLVNGWGSLIAPSGHRYIQVWNGSSYEAHQEDKHVKRQEGLSNQYHARLWNVPESACTFYGVIGSAHYDPWLHGKARDSPNWRFNESRGEVLKAWNDRLNESTTLQDVGNGSGYTDDESADGKVGLVY